MAGRVQRPPTGFETLWSNVAGSAGSGVNQVELPRSVTGGRCGRCLTDRGPVPTSTTPSRHRRAARLEIRNHNANTDIRDVNAAVRIDTHNGDVRVASLTGPLDLRMHNGWARVDFASFSQASHISTHNGVVELGLPAGSRFNFDSRGHHVHVESDFPLTTTASYYRATSRKVSGSVNGGGPNLRSSRTTAAFGCDRSSRSRKRRGAEGALPSGNRHLAQTLGTLLRRRIGRRLAATDAAPVSAFTGATTKK